MVNPQKDFFKTAADLADQIRKADITSGIDDRSSRIEQISQYLSLGKTIVKAKSGPLSFDDWNIILDWASGEGIIAELAMQMDPVSFFPFGEGLCTEAMQKAGGYSRFVYHYLNIFRQSNFLKKIYNEKKWEELVFNLIQFSNFTTSLLFKHRTAELRHKTLFRVLRGKEEYKYNWEQIAQLIDEHARALLSCAEKNREFEYKVAFLMENSIDMAILDLTCLTTGIVNIMVPANVVPQHLEFILNQTKAEILIVSGENQLSKIKQVKNKTKYLKQVISLAGNSAESWVTPLNVLLQQGEKIPDDMIDQMQNKIRINDLATIMYTSGTTGEPKGIMFSQMNLVYKRFCRAMALPEIGESDRFASYLPLFHTFGRYLEMLGAVFWGAEYVFMENPAINTLLDTMQRTKPSIFISIPKKWLELYNHVTESVDIMVDDENQIKQSLQSATGGKLRWGLSAAGFLEPEIFQFFQAYGVELMSGFGMTEATGGITMTPPGKYSPNSLGRELPGVDIKLADDGEMLIRGGYVMDGYYATDLEETFIDGWLPTGDIMRQDDRGFYEIIDRKKEIYKNLRGETIAPQRIENLFRDYEYINQVFLVGDHRPFNSVLFYPDEQLFEKMDEVEQDAYFSSIIVTTNKFLAPYERIVDFRLVERAFSAEMGELTPKSTYKRKVIEENFNDLINSMYEQNYVDLKWNNHKLRFPNWFLREKGCVKSDIIAESNTINIPKIETSLLLRFSENETDLIRIGDYTYRVNKEIIDFQNILSNPLYWIGNKDAVTFAGGGIYSWFRVEESVEELAFVSTVPREISEAEHERMMQLISSEEKSLEGLHLTVLHLRSCEMRFADDGLRYIQMMLEDDEHPLFDITMEIISRPKLACILDISREVFKIGLLRHKGERFAEYLRGFIESVPQFLDEALSKSVVDILKASDNILEIKNVLDNQIQKLDKNADLDKTPVPSLLNLLALFGIFHPTQYKRVRQMIVEYQLVDEMPELADNAGIVRKKLLFGFRSWLGENQNVAVDVETGGEYGWSDVITFEPDIDEVDKSRIMETVTETAMIREAIFLFSSGIIIRLYDIPQGGLWISWLGKLKDKNLYRLSVQTRFQGAYDLVLVIDQSKDANLARTEVNWIIHSSSILKGVRLVDEFGGYWPEYHIWTEAFVPGENVARTMQRSTRQLDEDKETRLYYLWRFIIWTATSAHVQFWSRTGKQFEVADKSMQNIIVPEHDYQTGERFISIVNRKNSKGILNLISDLYNQLIRVGEERYEFLKGDSVWPYVFSGIIEALGEVKGFEALADLENEATALNDDLSRQKKKDLEEFKKSVRNNGFLPRTLFFAIKRFHRWMQLNAEASKTAQAQTLNEFYETYQLNMLELKYPETRTRFFLDTVFMDSSEELRTCLKEIRHKQHLGDYGSKETLSVLSGVLKEYTLTEEELYFLTRLTYPHLKPTDTAFFLEEAEDEVSSPGVVVKLEDYDGNGFWIRQAMSPKEISKLHQLFLDNNLPVNFRSDDHFLVAISERGYIIGGLFYKYTDKEMVYMDKIVVANRFRKKGISEGLMNEFFNRLRDEHINFVTTGFLRPEYFYRFGFKIERKYAGLVKDLNN